MFFSCRLFSPSQVNPRVRSIDEYCNIQLVLKKLDGYQHTYLSFLPLLLITVLYNKLEFIISHFNFGKFPYLYRVFNNINSAVVRFHFAHCVQFWVLHLMKVSDKLRWVLFKRGKLDVRIGSRSSPFHIWKDGTQCRT